MKIIKKIINDKNKILIYENNNKKYVDKIFNNKNLIFFKKEILGIKYFKKKNILIYPKFIHIQLKIILAKLHQNI